MGDWFSPYTPPAAAVVDLRYVFRQTLYDPPSEITYMRDRFGLRGVHEPLPEIELVTVGGSTTDQRYITEGQTWQDVMRSAGGIRVANAGVDGMTSSGHVVAVKEWLHSIPGLVPKYYLHFIGINDAAALRLHRANFDVSGDQSALLRRLAARSALAKAVLYMRAIGASPREVAHSRIDVMSDAPFVKSVDDQGETRKYVDGTYRLNLRRLIELHRGRGETVLLVSQAANPQLVRWTDEGTFVSAQIANRAAWAQSLRLINVATREVCADEAEICRFIDLAEKIRFAPGDFYDAAHASPAGARKIGLFLASEIRLQAGVSK